MDDERMAKFYPEDIAACASEWQDYKRQFEVHLDSKGLHAAEGRQKVGQLLKCMGREHVATYDTFTWAPAIPAVVANSLGKMKVDLVLWYVQCFLMVLSYFKGAESKSG